MRKRDTRRESRNKRKIHKMEHYGKGRGDKIKEKADTEQNRKLKKERKSFLKTSR